MYIIISLQLVSIHQTMYRIREKPFNNANELTKFKFL